MKADPKVISDLMASCGMLATICEQFRVDGYALRNLGLKDLGHKFYPHWHQALEGHLNCFIKQLLNFETDPSYQVGPTQSGGDVRTMFSRDLLALTQAFQALCQRRKAAFDIRADAVTDEYEHAIQEVQHEINKIERWLKLIDPATGIGPKDFIGALVEA